MQCEKCQGMGTNQALINGMAYFDIFDVSLCEWCDGTGQSEKSYFQHVKVVTYGLACFVMRKVIDV